MRATARARSRRRRLAGWAGLLLASASAREAVAAPAVGGEEVGARAVIVGLAGAAAPFTAARATTALRGHVDDPLSVVAVDGEPYAWSRATAGTPGEPTVLWLELRPPGPHRLYLYAARTDRVYVRELADPGDADALLESLGAVIHALLSSVAAGEAPAGMRAIEAPSEPPGLDSAPAPAGAPSVPSPTPRARPSIEVAVSYLGRSLASAAPWQSGVGGRVAIVAPRGVVASIAGGWLAPARVDGAVALELRRAPFDATLGYRLRRARALSIDVGAALTLERLAWSVRGPAEARATGSTQALRIAVGPVIGIVWRVWRGLQVRSAARLDGWVRDVRLQVATPDGTQTTLAPPAAAAGLDVGLGWGF